MRRILILIFFIFTNELISLESDKDYNNLFGYLMDAKSKETLIGATISIPDLKKGAFTNKLGYYSISEIPPGKYEILITFIGYKPQKVELTFTKGQNLRKDFNLEPIDVVTDEIFIEADREVEKREITISKVNIPVKQLKEIRIGGETDVFRSLQYLPGVLTSSQISSGLYVRGGSPDQNLVLVDGSTVYNPSHLFGFISTFNSNAIKDVELIKGGYPAEYGGRLSAILNLTQKDGNREEYQGLASLGLLSSQFNVEGPVLNGSFFVGARRTYLELIKELFPEDPEFPLPDFNFYDVNAKLSQDLGNDDKIFISGFASADNLALKGYGANMNLAISNHLLSGRWTHIFSSNLFNTLNISTSKYINNLDGDQSGYEFVIENSITDFTLKNSLEWFTSQLLTSKFGFEINNYHFYYLQNFTGDLNADKNDSNSTVIRKAFDQQAYSSFAQFNYNINDLITIQAGLRFNYWTLVDDFVVNPRLALKYQLTEDISAKVAWGKYNQNLRLATQPDFSFFDTWLPTDNSVPLSSSEHYIFSLETYPWEGYHLDFDIYFKRMDNVSELNRTSLKAEKISDIFFIGKAESWGAEIFMQKSFGDLTGWFGYALGFIDARFDSINNGESFRPKYDRTHDLKLVLQYKLSEKFDIGAVFVFQSGQSYTGATSRFQVRLPGQNYGRGKLINSQLYGLRLPPSHQLNLNGSYYFKSFGLESRLILDIYNVYNRRDIWFRYYNTSEDEVKVEDVRLLPIIPTLTFEIKF